MPRRRIVQLLAGPMVALCGLTIAASALAPIEGSSGPGAPTAGSLLATMPRYGTFVLATGFAITLAAIRAVWLRQRGWPLALLATVAAVASGVAVYSTVYFLPSAVAERTYTVIQLRGTGPITIAVASLVGLILSLVLVVSSSEADLSKV